MRVPICSGCGRGMISSYCLAKFEWVCIPCGTGVGYFNDNPTADVSERQHNEMKEKYAKDIHKCAFEFGGATCAKCNKQGGNNCPTCAIDYEYEYFKTGRNAE